jgi:hypothetical protein
MESNVLEVNRTDIGATRIVTDQLGDLADGAVRFQIERFSITANTTTYAEFGDMLDYWGFWPSGDDTFGRVPAMGWATVIESNHPGVEAGGRYYGWFPMAQYIDAIVATTSTGLRDDGPNRAAHAPVYRTFERTDLDPMHPRQAEVAADAMDEAEDRHALVRGLFLTGYLADGFLDANDWFGADHAVVLSASSKTAIGFAACASQHDGLHLVGVTSPRNVDAVRELGWYDSVITYDQVTEAIADQESRAVVVDMAGNGPVLEALHNALGDRLAYSMVVGRTHHDAPPAAPSTGPTPEMFFAPTALVSMNEQGVDTERFQAAMGPALAAFIEGSSEWLAVERTNGPAASADTWADVLTGRVAPSVGRITSLHAD